MKDFSLRLTLWVIRFFSIPLVLFVVALNLAHPLLHSMEGGALDVMLPMLDVTAVSLGGGRIITWAKRHGHRHHDHAEHDCHLDG